MDRRRNRGNEVIVALVVIGTLAIALTFGIILTLSSHADEPTDSDRTATTVSWNARNTMNAVTKAASTTGESTQEVAVQPSSTATEAAQPAATNTVLPTDRPIMVAETEEASDEPPAAAAATEEAVETQEPPQQPTERPSGTPGEEPTEKPTQRPTLRIPTLTPTERPTLTDTPRPSDTPTRTPTRTPSPTPTRQPSNTPRPTQTFTPTATEIKATLTFTPYPTLTPSITPFGGERTNTPVPSGCTVPQGWIGYTIQPGDTLFRLSLRFNLPQSTLAQANCLPNAANITAGQILFVPPGSNVTPSTPAGNAPAGSTPAASVPAGNPPSGNYSSFDCGNPAATISSPVAGTVLRGTVAVFGTATHPDFQFYRLQVSGGGTGDGDFATLDVYNAQVYNGQLGTLNTAAFAPGDYWLRLTVVDNTGNYLPQCTVRVRFEP